MSQSIADQALAPPAFDAPFRFGDSVIIDNQRSRVAVVTAFMWRREDDPMVQVSYFHKGSPREAWVQHWRLSRVVEDAGDIPKPSNRTIVEDELSSVLRATSERYADETMRKLVETPSIVQKIQFKKGRT